jgi:lysophospholipase L1-like esterase
MPKEEDFRYSNHNQRGKSRKLQLAGWFWPGLRKVQRQIGPYAEAWMSANASELRANGPLWVVLGDSMAQGVGASSYDKGWVGQLRTMLAAEGHEYRVVNLSLSGARIEDVLDIELPALWRLGVRPDLVTVLIGANNMSNRFRHRLVPDMTALLSQLPAHTVIGDITGDSVESQKARELLAAEAAKRQFRIADTRYAFRPPSRPKVSEDLFHPNDAGYAEIAKVFLDAIKRP